MRKWMVLAALAVALLAIVVLRIGAGRSGMPAPVPGAPASAPGAPGHAQGAPPSGTGGQPAEDMFHHAPMADEFTLMLRAYPITRARLEAYAAVVREIREAGTADAGLMTKLRERRPGESPADIAARLEAIAPLKAILDRHGLRGMDLVQVPRVVAMGRNAYALEQESRPLAPDQQNPAATALFRADLPGVDAIEKGYLADLATIQGR